MALLQVLFLLYVAIGVAYTLHVMRDLVRDKVLAKILCHRFRLRLTLFLFFTFGWLPHRAYQTIQILRSTKT